jgi:GTP-binding protein EngB required for normal cell division
MGMTGVGKSSLINYLAGEELAEAGISSQAGGLTRGIHKYSISINSQPCNVFDSEGLETSHSEYWKDMMEQELLEKSSNQALSYWYHIVVYCIGANSGRVQPFELDMIEKLINYGYGVIIAFTKADIATDEELDKLHDTIENHFSGNTQLKYIPICAKKTRNNVLEGKEELSDAIIDAWGESLIYRLPDYVFSTLDEMQEWGESVLDWIADQNMGLFGKSKETVLNEVNVILQDQIREWNKDIQKKQQKATKDMRLVYAMLNQVLNISSVTLNQTESITHIAHIDESILGNSSSIKTIAKNAAIGALAVLNPIVGISLGAASILRSSAKNKEAKEVIENAFIEQYNLLVEAYANQKEFFDCSLGASLGYIYGYKGLGTKYLFGIGVQKNMSLALDNFQKIVSLVEESGYEFTDPYSEFYYSYIQFMKGNESEAKKWLHLAAKHGSTRARLVIENVPYREVAEDEDYDN